MVVIRIRTILKEMPKVHNAIKMIILLSSISMIMMLNVVIMPAHGLVFTSNTGKKFDTGKSFDKQMAVNGTMFIKKFADKEVPLGINATDFCVNKVKSIVLFHNMCDSAVSLLFELCQISFVNASHTECKTSNSLHQWMTYRNLTDGQTDLIVWDLFTKAMRGQISKSGF